MEILVAHGSILTILAISFERYYAICRPLHAGYKCTKRRALVIILIIWILALLSTLPMLSITQLSTAEYIDGSTVTVCSNSLQEGWHPIYYLAIFVTFFVIPFMILVILYVLISKKLTSESQSLSNSSNLKHRAQVRRQVIVMLASVCITFFVCLLPFRLMTVWIIMSSPEDIIDLGMETYYSILFICRILLYVNSSANPILYNLISSKFRQAFFNILRIDRGSLRASQYNTRSGDGHSILSERFSTTMIKGTANGVVNGVSPGGGHSQPTPCHTYCNQNGQKYSTTLTVPHKNTRDSSHDRSIDVHSF